MKKNRTPDNQCRVIKTARDIDTINEAVKKGNKIVVKKVHPSVVIRTKFAIVRDNKTGEIRRLTDFRNMDEDRYEMLLDWTKYYPYHFPAPFAAYVVPPDIKIGEKVWLEDLIEDLIGKYWNQGDTFRLDSCEAIWNGSDFEIQYNFKNNITTVIG